MNDKFKKIKQKKNKKFFYFFFVLKNFFYFYYETQSQFVTFQIKECILSINYQQYNIYLSLGLSFQNDYNYYINDISAN